MRKLICFGVMLVMCLGLFFGCETASGEGKPTGKFYTLQEAYDQGLLTVDDLQSIANYFNNNITPTDTINVAIEKAILETAAEKPGFVNSERRANFLNGQSASVQRAVTGFGLWPRNRVAENPCNKKTRQYINIV